MFLSCNWLDIGDERDLATVGVGYSSVKYNFVHFAAISECDGQTADGQTNERADISIAAIQHSVMHIA